MLRNIFQNFLMQVRDWINRMIQPNDVKRALNIDTALSEPMTTALQTWADMYTNNASWINDDPIKPVKSLNLPSVIASEIARQVTIEMEMEISGSPRADYLALQLKPVKSRIKQGIEYGGAKGGLVFKPYISGKNIPIDMVHADQFYPVSFDGLGNMTGVVFQDNLKIGDWYYKRLEYHSLSNNVYTIKNAAFRSSSDDTLGNEVPLASVDAWADLQPEAAISPIEKPLFGYFRPPLANNIDPASPLGVSWYARAVSLIQQADELWSNLIWEFRSGERAIYVDETAFTIDTSTGKPKLPDNRLYRPLKVSTQIGDKNSMFDAWSPEFRDASIRAGLNDIFKRIEFNCGLAYGTISDPSEVDKTATEIISAKQRSASTVVDNQKALQSALDDLLYAVDVWTTLYSLAPRGVYEATYEFDDSTVVDHDTQFTQDSLSLGQKTMSRTEFRMRNYGESEAVAKKKIAEIDADSINRVDLFSLGDNAEQGV